MSLRHVVVAGMLLCIASCGFCEPDATPGFAPVLGVAAQFPAIALVPPPPCILVDVALVLDDSDFMNTGRLGVVGPPGDDRVRTEAAQAILRALEARLTARLAVEYAPDRVPVFDLAFSVARFEDFGGAFYDRKPDVTTGNLDAYDVVPDEEARPFILNMPMLRTQHPDFARRFAEALAREAPGDGNITLRHRATGTTIHVRDPQSGIEALYQVATGDGFDGDGNGSTADSGPPTAWDPDRDEGPSEGSEPGSDDLNPQNHPGPSGDVPAIEFALIEEEDAGHALYEVLCEDENGDLVPVLIPDGFGGETPSQASGCLGGVGFRPGAAHFVVLVSDVATVAPTQRALTLNGVAEGAQFSSTAGAPDAPREARDDVLVGAFDGRFAPDVNLTTVRIGPPGGSVSPENAHTIEETIAALNDLDIEVLFLGHPFLGFVSGAPVKPGTPGVNGDAVARVREIDVTSPLTVRRDPSPFSWFTAMSRLTTPEVTSIDVSGSERTFPGVYDITTVWPYNPFNPNDEATITNVMEDDLAERIRDWERFLLARPPVPPALFDMTLSIVPRPEDGDTGEVVRIEPLGDISLGAVRIPTYWNDDAVQPLPSILDQIEFPFTTRDADVALPAQGLFRFVLRGTLIDELGDCAFGAVQRRQLRRLLTSEYPDFDILHPNESFEISVSPVVVHIEEEPPGRLTPGEGTGPLEVEQTRSSVTAP